MMKRVALIVAAAASILFTAAVLEGQENRTPKIPLIAELGPTTLTVNGSSGSTAMLTAADLYQLPQQTVKATDHGTTISFQDVLLTDVLAKIRTPTSAAFNKSVASYCLVVQAADGYRAVFSWPEIDPSFTDRKVHIVTKRDGVPLSPKDGPFELIVPGEKRHSRWVRQGIHLRYDLDIQAAHLGRCKGKATWPRSRAILAAMGLSPQAIEQSLVLFRLCRPVRDTLCPGNIRVSNCQLCCFGSRQPANID